MTGASAAGSASVDVSVIVGVDCSGRTHRLGLIAATAQRPVLRVNPPGLDADRLAKDLAEAGDALVLVDDAHRLSGDELAALTAAARRGTAIILARRPSIPSPAHADLEEALPGRVEQLQPLEAAAIGELMARCWERPVTPAEAESLHAACGGLPGIAVLLTPPAEPGPSLVARVQRRLAVLPPPIAALARLLALRLDLPDPVLADASEKEAGKLDLGAAMRELADEGMLIPGTERMIPAVAAAILADLPAAQRRRVHEAVARALTNANADPIVAAGQLRAARAYVPASAAIFATAAERLRLSDPAAAVAWYDDAVEAGADPAAIALGRAEAAALLGLPADAPVDVPPADAERAALLAGVVEAHHGRADRAAASLRSAGVLGAQLAVPSLVAVGELEAARACAGDAGSAPTWMRRQAEATLLAVTDPAGSVPVFIEAAEAYERTTPNLVLPETPHALGAQLASLTGDAASAEHLLERAIAEGIGGPVFGVRHEILLALVRLRAGRYDTAVALLERGLNPTLTGRERLLAAALSAGVARRSGDIATLREAWRTVEPVLARRAFDLFTAEAVEELAVAATRLRQHARVAPVLDTLDEIVAKLGHPAAWRVSVGWLRVQVAIAAEDPDAAGDAAGRIADACRSVREGTRPATAARHHALCAAAEQWARVLAGDVDPDAVTAVSAELAAVDLPWEGSRLVGQAGIRTSDAAVARRLLERARDLSSAEVTSEKGRAESSYGGLSEREVEVARMVLAGDTYREIGARLFISPKTVEHHVARIRTKLGATSRAEFLAALRDVLGEGA
ncbi:MAG TPA: LuxR C-terminal-related transcriptional regulator [Micromonosporaceae bacterium]|nr:LuxR C-terminal-related transcriptional regulator [Micromonosporaceae bacterium]